MSRSWCRVKPATEQVLVPVQKACPECGRAMRIRYTNRRAVVSLRGLVCLRLKIRRCEDRSCGRYHQAWRPEAARMSQPLSVHHQQVGRFRKQGQRRRHRRDLAERQEACPFLITPSDHSAQIQCRPPPPHPESPLQGDELVGLRGWPALARLADDLVHGRGDRGLAGGGASRLSSPALADTSASSV